MDIKTIGVEEWLNVWEKSATWDIAQSTISSLTMGELRALDEQDGATFYERLDRAKMNYGWIEGSPEFKAEVAKLYRCEVNPDHILQTNGCTGANLNTIMAGLACGEPNTISWDILKNHVTTFISADDPVTVRGMRLLAAPLKGDAPIISGESGAVPFGALATIMLSDECKELRSQLGLDENSQVLAFSTEGDTDPERYKNIVWRGLDK